MDRLIQIYAKNSQEVDDVYSIQKVCQCIADDEFFTETGIEPEVLEIFSFYNKQIINESRSERSASYDYLQKNNSQRDEESQGSASWHNSQGNMDNEQLGEEGENDHPRGSMNANDVVGLINDSVLQQANDGQQKPAAEENKDKNSDSESKHSDAESSEEQDQVQHKASVIKSALKTPRHFTAEEAVD